MRIYEIEQLDELTGIKKLKPTTYNNDVISQIQIIDKWMEKNGFTQLSEPGYAAMAFSKPNSNSIIKILFRDDKGYNLFLDLIKKHPSIHWPKIEKILNVPWRVNAVIKMEKLTPLSIKEKEAWFEIYSIINKYAKHKNENDMKYLGSLVNQIGQDQDFIDLISFLIHEKPNGIYMDLHSDNVMKRNDGTFVIIDPYA